MATRAAIDRWDKVLTNIQRTAEFPPARLARRALLGGQTGMDLPANAFSGITGTYTSQLVELWAARPPQDPQLLEILQPVHDAAYRFTPYKSLLPQIDHFLEVVAAAREALSRADDTPPIAEEIIADLKEWLTVALLVAGTGHVGPMTIINTEIKEQARSVNEGFRTPPRHYDFAKDEVVHVPTDTSVSFAVFAADVDPLRAATWEEALTPNPDDQPLIMKQFATQLIVTLHTEWEEYYRPELAKALGCDRDEIRSEYFADINRMRQDYVHKMRGIARNSAKNVVLKWYSKGDNMIPTRENYVQLLIDFPAAELLAPPPPPPEHLPSRKPIGANADPKLVRQFEEIADRLDLNKDTALDLMITEFLAAHA